MTSFESGSGGLPGEGDQGQQAPTAETLAELDRLLERCGKPDSIEDEGRANVIVAPAAPEELTFRSGADAHYLQVTATLRVDERKPAGVRPPYGELVITEVIPRFDEYAGVLSDTDLYEKLWSIYRKEPAPADVVGLAGYIVGQAGPNLEHNEIVRKKKHFADGSVLDIYRCRPISGPITWEPEVAETLHVEHRHPSGRAVVYVVRSDGTQELYVTETGSRASEVSSENRAVGRYLATEDGVRELIDAVGASLDVG